MALITEDGTGKADAESLISVADADTYFSNRGNATWAALTTAEKEQNLRKGTDYLEQVYRLRWKGARVTSTQALSWPRAWVKREDYYSTGGIAPDTVDGEFYYPSDEVPVEVTRACAELAYKANSADLAPDIEQRVKREKIDVIETEYADYGPQYTTYRSIDNLLAPFLQNTGASRKVVRS